MSDMAMALCSTFAAGTCLRLDLGYSQLSLSLFMFLFSDEFQFYFQALYLYAIQTFAYFDHYPLFSSAMQVASANFEELRGKDF